VAACSKAWVYCLSLAGAADSNSTGGGDVYAKFYFRRTFRYVSTAQLGGGGFCTKSFVNWYSHKFCVMSLLCSSHVEGSERSHMDGTHPSYLPPTVKRFAPSSILTVFPFSLVFERMPVVMTT
jgi:hypothetical protein